MSRPLFFTSMIRPEMMFAAAIRTSIIRISRMTLRSTFRAPQKAALRSVQSVTVAAGPAMAATSGLSATALSGSASLSSMKSGAPSRPKNRLACSMGM